MMKVGIFNSFFNTDLLQMVFADRGEIISGGNFHGEYPAKVSLATRPSAYLFKLM